MKHTSNIFYGQAALDIKEKDVSLETVTLDNETYFKMSNYDEMTPFFMTVVSDSDHWMFVSSTGGLTCGRKNAESALFPYETDDKIHDSIETAGPNTQLILKKDGKKFLWKPFTRHMSSVYTITRNLYKNTTGNKIRFEEINHDLNVSYAYTLKNSERFGFVKESVLENLSDESVEVKLLDGIRNILPYGVNTLLQTTKSTLVDGYKRSELIERAGLGIYTLSSILTDKAEPSESLKATTVWSSGLEDPQYLLSEQQLDAFAMDADLQTEEDVKGRRGSYYVVDTLTLGGADAKRWMIVSELNQNAADVEKLNVLLEKSEALNTEVEKDVAQGDVNLEKLVFEADGFQKTSNEKASYRHFSNTLYNIMRGGIYADGYTVDREDFKEFIETWNTNVFDQRADFLEDLPETIHYNELLNRVSDIDDKDLERLTMEYLPLTFSRRHGDPSRPWNQFNIELTKEDGSKALKFEGNWRDIFQNWEALSMSFPAYTESIIAKFVNASTPDGYNPYRITKEGIDWETLDPDDPWSNIGYWGDHQIIYLLKLLEMSKDYHPEKLLALLHKDIFVYANVPYRIKGFDALVSDPRNSIDYDDDSEALIAERVKDLGSDGKFVFKGDGLYKVNLMEKLLVSLLSKFSNYVPEGGIWMNTQRPEWNDANNALVGNGLSMVTLYYMHRFQKYMSQLVEDMDSDTVSISAEVLQMFEDTLAVLKEKQSLLGEDISDTERYEIVEALGRIGEAYRQSVYTDGFSGEKKDLSISMLKEFTEVTLDHLNDSIKKNKRTDGLYHSYNLIRFEENSCSVSHLYEMLEGQVSVLSSKALDGEEALSVLKALKKSAIYREDQNSYMLYPNRELPRFLEKNVIPEEKVMSSAILKAELENDRSRFIEKDVKGNYHFNGNFRNGEEIEEALKATGEYPDEEIRRVKEIFSDLFNHHAFTGRSGTFYKYEGLGSIYWHMVSKLALAVQENFFDTYSRHGMNKTAEGLISSYEDIKAGIGVDKSPEQYGAFPTEAYSHTPSFAGVQQPGMTGQVKEDIISRFGELGVTVEEGLIKFSPVLLQKSEFLNEKISWNLPQNNASEKESIQLDEQSLGFTMCAVPVTYELKGKKEILVSYRDGTEEVYDDTDVLSEETSQSLFNREGRIARIRVSLDGSTLQ
ncbi:hypothetical protein AB4027_09165 [Alkalibacterium putridalgicola]|uniref:hypothetical protein n=1 Tax=Alkalibacterium putridalgicola TaxID=426703 RepID=UPI0034CDC59C